MDRPGELIPGLRACPSPPLEPGLFEALREETPWEAPSILLFGQRRPVPRLVQMYGPHGYRYSGIDHPPRPLTPRLERLRAQVEDATGLRFNSVLLNLYRDGQDSMGWHRDDDYACEGRTALASLSLGASRRFWLRHRRDHRRRLDLILEHGALWLLDGEARTEWQHAVPKETRPTGTRINLTWRWMAPEEHAAPAPGLRAAAGRRRPAAG